MEFGGGDADPLQLQVCRNASLNEYVGRSKCSASSPDIMLATGLKDKNSNDVYEGDICQGKISIACVIKEMERGTVVYNPKTARFELKCGNTSLPLNMISALQVIGHIHDDSDRALKSPPDCDLQ